MTNDQFWWPFCQCCGPSRAGIKVAGGHSHLALVIYKFGRAPRPSGRAPRPNVSAWQGTEAKNESPFCGPCPIHHVIEEHQVSNLSIYLLVKVASSLWMIQTKSVWLIKLMHFCWVFPGLLISVECSLVLAQRDPRNHGLMLMGCLKPHSHWDWCWE